MNHQDLTALQALSQLSPSAISALTQLAVSGFSGLNSLSGLQSDHHDEIIYSFVSPLQDFRARIPMSMHRRWGSIRMRI